MVLTAASQDRRSPPMTAHHIRFEVDGDGIATLTIDRPEKRNAMTYAMLGEFIGKIGEAGEDERVRVLIVTGSGGAVCAGTDLADLAPVPGETRGTRGSARGGGKKGANGRAPT